jgi:hypothetical protein
MEVGGAAEESKNVMMHDIIESIDDAQISHLTTPEVQRLLAGPEGSQVTLVLLRGSPSAAARGTQAAKPSQHRVTLTRAPRSFPRPRPTNDLATLVDAVVTKTPSARTLVDAVVTKTPSAQTLVDAVVAKTPSAQTLVDAVVTKTPSARATAALSSERGTTALPSRLDAADERVETVGTQTSFLEVVCALQCLSHKHPRKRRLLMSDMSREEDMSYEEEDMSYEEEEVLIIYNNNALMTLTVLLLVCVTAIPRRAASAAVSSVGSSSRRRSSGSSEHHFAEGGGRLPHSAFKPLAPAVPVPLHGGAIGKECDARYFQQCPQRYQRNEQSDHRKRGQGRGRRRRRQ